MLRGEVMIGRCTKVGNRWRESAWKPQPMDCHERIALDHRVGVHEIPKRDGWRPWAMWPNVVIRGVYAFEIFPFISNPSELGSHGFSFTIIRCTNQSRHELNWTAYLQCEQIRRAEENSESKFPSVAPSDSPTHWFSTRVAGSLFGCVDEQRCGSNRESWCLQYSSLFPHSLTQI